MIKIDIYRINGEQGEQTCYGEAFYRKRSAPNMLTLPKQSFTHCTYCTST